MVPVPHTAASRMPVADLRAAARRSGYGFWSTKPEHVDRLEPGVLLAEAVAVEQQRNARVDAQPEVMAAARADALVLVELLVVEHLLAIGTARPQVGRVDSRRPPKGSLMGMSGLPYSSRRAGCAPGPHRRAGESTRRTRSRRLISDAPVDDARGADTDRPRSGLAQLLGQALLEQERRMETRHAHARAAG